MQENPSLRRFSIKIDSLFLGILAVLSLAAWYPTLHLPYWWDSAGFVIQEAHGNFTSHLWLFPDFSAYAHPPLLVFILAIAWRIFGESITVSHFAYLPFVIGSLYALYFLSVEIFDDVRLGRIIGFFSSLLLLFTPVYMAQVGIIYLEIPTIALALMSYIFFLKRRFFLYALAASLMVLAREFTVIIVLIFLVVEWATLYKKRKIQGFSRGTVKRTALLVLPVAVLASWFLYHWFNSGWFAVKPGTKLPGLESHVIPFVRFGKVAYYILLDQWRFIPMGIAIGCIVRGYLSSPNLWKQLHQTSLRILVPFIAIPILYLGLFTKTEFLPRYAIIIFPFLYLGSLFLLTTMLKKYRFFIKVIVTGSITVLCCILFYTNWNLHREINSYYFTPLEDNLEYLDVIHVGQQVARYVEKHYQRKAIYTSFPTNYMLGMPFQGYVHSKLLVKGCESYDGKGGIIVFHFFSPESIVCGKILEASKASLVKAFEENGKIIAVFEIHENVIKSIRQ